MTQPDRDGLARDVIPAAAQPEPIMLPAGYLTRLGQLLTEMDDFLRSDPIIAAELAHHLSGRGHAGARFDANNLIDEVSFTAERLAQFAGAIQWAGLDHTRPGGHPREEIRPARRDRPPAVGAP